MAGEVTRERVCRKRHLTYRAVIVGLGIDIVEIARIRKAMANPKFIARILTPAEREYCKTVYQVAGRWTAKEAVAKAVGLSLTWQEVEILPNELGEPTAKVASRHLDPTRLRLRVSISHEKNSAVAVAILERITIQAPERLI
jgi:holo-[acyl-carrier protein] synthase